MATSSEGGLAQFGMIGLGVMGQNLALNVADHGFKVAVWNREADRVDKMLADNPGKNLVGSSDLKGFVDLLERPRRIMLLIKAGSPVDEMIEKLKPLLVEGDIIIDGGNSWFKDTQKRTQYLTDAKLHFVGSGVSGGEEGARNGPSLMPGGPLEAYTHVKPIFEAIAAKTNSGACVTHCGPDGAGHFVKMVHNGIEYGDMQLIAEAYEIMRVAGGLDAGELGGVFTKWNDGPLESFLIEITSKIFTVKDEVTGKPLVDLVLDKAGQKGTGKWTAQIALDLGISIPTIAAAIDARVLSSMKGERVNASKRFKGPDAGGTKVDREKLISDVQDALYASKICAYAQGMSLIRAGSDEFKWNINMREMARIWKGGCIIRARFLDSIVKAYEKDANLPNLLMDQEFGDWVQKAQASWRRAVTLAQTIGVAIPAMSASLAYFDSYRSERLPANLTQAQRDFFGSHTYQRADQVDGEFVHTEWSSKSEDE